MYRALLLFAPLGLAACQAPFPGGLAGDRPQPHEQVASAPECVVTSARQVQLIGGAQGSQPIGTISGERADNASAAPKEGSTGVIGAQASSPSPSGINELGAVEYTVQEGSSERVIVQNIDVSGTVLSAGTACQVIGEGADQRVVWG